MTETSRPGAAAPFLSTLRLTDFRNYHRLVLGPGPGAVVLVGDNGAGKTNLLEAVSFLSPGRGFRRAANEAVARLGSSGAWAVAAALETAEGTVAIGTGLSEGDAGRARRVRIDGHDATAEALSRLLSVLWLTPAMDGLFTGSPGDRRRFLDRLVLAVDAGHIARVTAYERAMTERNRLLEQGGDARWLDAVEVQLAETGVAVAAARRELVGCLERLAEEAGGGDFPVAGLAIAGAVDDDLAARPATAVEDHLRAKLRDGRGRDRAAGRTLDGPHRSDLVVTHREKAMPAALSSTGEQKALLIGLVIAHAELVAALTGRTPVLLLDEVAAHLDARRRGGLFARIARLGAQAFMTGTDSALFDLVGAPSQRFTVSAGTVAPA